MARPFFVPLLILSLLFCGCGTARQSVGSEGDRTEVRDTATSSPPRGVLGWLDDHPIVKYTGLGALAVTVGVLIGILLFAALLAAAAASIH